MIERTLAKRYAAALLQASKSRGATAETEATLLALKTAWESNKSLRLLLCEPRIPRARRISILKRPFMDLAQPAFLEFLSILMRKNRIRLIPEIADAFSHLSEVSRGEVRAQLRSWQPLTDLQQGVLTERLAKLTGKRVLLDAAADPSLKGGLMVRIGDTVIDGTVVHRLKALAERLKKLERE